MRIRQARRWVAPLLVALLAGVATSVGDGLAQEAPEPEFTFAPAQGVGAFDGFGVQLNQHLYADISGPPPGIPALEREVLAFRAPLVRIFFNTTEWALPDRMSSYSACVAAMGSRPSSRWRTRRQVS